MRLEWISAFVAVADSGSISEASRRLGVSKSVMSERLAELWRPYVETVVEAFGASRCMMESNFPVDRWTCDYRTLWNALKRTVAGASADEKAELFAGVARRFYRLDI